MVLEVRLANVKMRLPITPDCSEMKIASVLDYAYFSKDYSNYIRFVTNDRINKSRA